MICACYFFLLYGVLDSVTMEMMPVYGAVFLVSRSFSAFSVVTFPKMKKEGTVADFSEKAQNQADSAYIHSVSAACFSLDEQVESLVWLLGNGRRNSDICILLSDVCEEFRRDQRGSGRLVFCLSASL